MAKRVLNISPLPLSKMWRKVSLLFLGGSLLLFWGLRFFRGPAIPAVEAKRGGVVQKVVASGVIVPESRVRINAQVFGTLSEVLVDEGELVVKNQVIARIASDEADALVQQARAAFEQAQTRAEQFQVVNARLAREALKQSELRMSKARLTLQREEVLIRENATTQEALDAAKSELQVAESLYHAAKTQAQASEPKGTDSRMALSAVEQSQGALKAAEARQANFTVKAPMDGKIIERRTEIGDSVQVGTNLFVLGSSGPDHDLRAKVQIDEKYLSLIQEKQEATVTADAYPAHSLKAYVERIAPAVNQERGAVEVRLVIPDPPPFIRFDMSASVSIVTNAADGTLILPTDAIQATATSSPFVYVAQKGRVKKTEIVLGLRGDGVIEVTGGIHEGDLVLLTTETLLEGSRVRPELKGLSRAL